MAYARSSRRNQGRRPAAPARKLGNWKLAYADFLTALCAFFLIMWIVHGVSAADKQDLASQFKSAPAVENTRPLESLPMKGSARASQAVVSQLRQSPSLTAFGTSVRIEAEANHVRLELSDGEYLPLFDTGDGRLNARGEALVRAAALAIMALPYDLKLEGHTDANPSLTPGYSNWELSADRANAARRILLSSGIPEARLKGISGLAATRPLMQQSPHLPVNRRISIVLVIENNAAS